MIVNLDKFHNTALQFSNGRPRIKTIHEKSAVKIVSNNYRTRKRLFICCYEKENRETLTLQSAGVFYFSGDAPNGFSMASHINASPEKSW